MSWATATGSGLRLRIQVQPRASKSEVVGLYGDALKIRLAAPPVDGAANDELIAFLAKRLGVPKSRISLVAGTTSRAKTVAVEGIPAETAARLLQLG
jgi:uncharacterized protein (TIGR00251 family)